MHQRSCSIFQLQQQLVQDLPRSGIFLFPSGINLIATSSNFYFSSGGAFRTLIINMIHWVNRSTACCCSRSGRSVGRSVVRPFSFSCIKTRAPFSVEIVCKSIFLCFTSKGGRWKLNGNSVIPQKYELLRRLRPPWTMDWKWVRTEEDAPVALLCSPNRRLLR